LLSAQNYRLFTNHHDHRLVAGHCQLTATCASCVVCTRVLVLATLGARVPDGAETWKGKRSWTRVPLSALSKIVLEGYAESAKDYMPRWKVQTINQLMHYGKIKGKLLTKDYSRSIFLALTDHVLHCLHTGAWRNEKFTNTIGPFNNLWCFRKSDT
jgi:hypothetical protein